MYVCYMYRYIVSQAKHAYLFPQSFLHYVAVWRMKMVMDWCEQNMFKLWQLISQHKLLEVLYM